MRLVKNTTAASIVTLDQAKAQLNILSTREDVFVQDLLDRAHSLISQRSNLALSSTDFTWTLNNVCGYLPFPVWPVPSISSVTSVTVKEEFNSTPVALDEGTDYYMEDNYLVLVDSTVYQEVIVIFTAGFTNSSRPIELEQAVLLALGTWYGNRQDDVSSQMAHELPMGVDTIVAPIRYKKFY